PWLVELIDSASPESVKGNMNIRINDLIIAFQGDIYDPFRGRWYYDRTFFQMTAFLQMPVRLESDSGDLTLSFDAIPFAYVSDFHSDYIPVNKNMANTALAELTPMLTHALCSMSVS